MKLPLRPLPIRLVAGVLFVNLFVYALAGVALYQSRQQYEHVAIISTQNLAHSLATNVSGVVDKVDVGLFSVTHEVERQIGGGGIDGKLLSAYLSGQQAQIRDFEGMWVADGEGDIRWGTDILSGKPVNIADREYFRHLQKNPASGLVISKPVIGRVTKTWSILIARRINRADGTFAGVALGSLRAVDYFTNMFSGIDVGKQGLIGLRDDEMALITRYPKATNESGNVGSKVVSDKTVEMVRSNPDSGTYRSVAAQDGIERISSYRKVAAYPLYIFVSRGIHDSLTPWRREAVITLSLLAVFTLVTVISSRISYKRTAEMLEAQEMARRKGDLELLVNERTRELQAANNELESFSYSVSHDLRAPLRAIEGFSSLLENEYSANLDERGKDYFRRIRGGITRMAQLIEDLLDLSKISRQRMHKGQVNLSALVQEAADELQATEPDRRVEWMIAPEISAEGDSGLLRIALQNLVGNAWKYSSKRERARIEFGVGQWSGQRAFFVRDNGEGFDMAHADKLFGAFQRLHSAEEFAGTGIGLATVERIIHRHGGTVGAEGKVHDGATFYFTL